jgi:hypothetical protein
MDANNTGYVAGTRIVAAVKLLFAPIRSLPALALATAGAFAVA